MKIHENDDKEDFLESNGIQCDEQSSFLNNNINDKIMIEKFLKRRKSFERTEEFIQAVKEELDANINIDFMAMPKKMNKNLT
jgi:hypothetical protein